MLRAAGTISIRISWRLPSSCGDRVESAGRPAIPWPEGSQAWQTHAVGRNTSQTEIDRNQFPGSPSLDVRVIQTTGFDENVIAEQKFDIEN